MSRAIPGPGWLVETDGHERGLPGPGWAVENPITVTGALLCEAPAPSSFVTASEVSTAIVYHRGLPGTDWIVELRSIMAAVPGAGWIVEQPTSGSHTAVIISAAPVPLGEMTAECEPVGEVDTDIRSVAIGGDGWVVETDRRSRGLASGWVVETIDEVTVSHVADIHSAMPVPESSIAAVMVVGGSFIDSAIASAAPSPESLIAADILEFVGAVIEVTAPIPLSTASAEQPVDDSGTWTEVTQDDDEWTPVTPSDTTWN